MSSPASAAAAALAAFEPAAPALVSARALQRRVDRKFLLPASAIPALLLALRPHFHAVWSGEAPAAAYETSYFDTPDLRMFHDHRRGRRPRHKVRVRHHLDRRLTFLEVKRKGSDDHTSKARLARPFGDEALDAEARAFVAANCPIDPEALAVQAGVGFRRATLVGPDVEERITLDWGLVLRHGARELGLPELAVAEIKQARFANRSPSVVAFRALRIRERPVSKYCLAIVRLREVQSNAFKPALRVMEHLSA